MKQPHVDFLTFHRPPLNLVFLTVINYSGDMKILVFDAFLSRIGKTGEEKNFYFDLFDSLLFGKCMVVL